jgi:predicted PurR-regulated permease PerM
MRQLQLVIPWSTILKVLLAVLLTCLVLRLAPLLELLILALLIALTFLPLLQAMEKRRWPRWSGVLLSALLLFGLTISFFALLVPTIGSEGTEVISRLPSFKEQTLRWLPAAGALHDYAARFFSSSNFNNPEPLLKQFVAWGTIALAGLAEFFLVLIVAIYFMADGPRVYRWLLAFLPQVHRRKVRGASNQIVSVVSHYMAGQVITSALCGVYAFIVLALLRVPNAAILAVIAAVFDILPLLGFFLFTIPAVLIALTVSPLTALAVALLYLAYHLVENYFIVPKVYGNALRLSTLTVLVSCLAAAMIAGVVGVIIVLPLVASYPIIEGVWLRPYLGRETVEGHERVDRAAHG